MFRRRKRQSPTVLVYSERFRHVVSPNEIVLEAGSGYNVGWAMEHGDSMNNGLLVITEARVFHCLDYGPLTWQTARANIIGVSTSKHPLPQTMNFHITYLGDGGVHSQMTFYLHPLFAGSARNLLR